MPVLNKNEYCFKQYSSFILVVLASVVVFQSLVSTCNLLKRYYSELAQPRASAVDGKLYGRNDVFLLLVRTNIFS